MKPVAGPARTAGSAIPAIAASPAPTWARGGPTAPRTRALPTCLRRARARGGGHECEKDAEQESSWPDSFRPSTPFLTSKQDADGRDKHGYDVARLLLQELPRGPSVVKEHRAEHPG